MTKASLFVTCTVEQFYPEVGESTVRVLRGLGVDVDFPELQTCCGQVAFNSGFWSDARPTARRFLEIFQGDSYIVTPSGSCAAMVRMFYEELFHNEPGTLRLIRAVAPRVFELSEFIVDVLDACDSFGPSVKNTHSSPRTVTYHEACHLRRELGATIQPRKLIKSVPYTELVEMGQAEVCCGFGGTFSVKYPEISGAMLEDKISNIRKTDADFVVACDSTCLMQIAGGLNRAGLNTHPLHLAQFLDKQSGLFQE